jgi:PAS domain S-box-containing protein
MTENNMDINSELLKINEELKAEIARHRETTRLLTEKQHFLSNILTNAPIVIWCIDNEGIFTYSQYAGENALPDSERIGKSALEIYKGTEVETFIRKVINGEIQNGILSVRGVVYDTRVSPLFDANGDKTGYMGVSMDITDRVKTEKELEKFRLVLDQAPGAVYIMDKNWNFEYINPWFTKMSGYSAEELLNKNIGDTLYKGFKEIPASRQEITKSLFEGKSWQGELHTINKDGSRYWANTIAAPFCDKNGDVDGYIVIQQDISDKKRIELELAEKENLYRTLIEKSLDGVSISQNGKIIMVNQAFCDMFGYTIDEMLTKEPSSLIAEKDRERVLDLHYKRMRGELKTNSYLASMIHKNGSEIIVDINASTVLMNGLPASFVTMRDVTEKNRIQKALQESEIKYKTLVDNSQDGIMIIRNNQILFANNTICRMLKTTPDQLTAFPATDIVHPDDRTKAQKMSALRAKGETGTMLDYYRLKVVTGEYIETESFSTVVDYEGLPASFITVHDITEKNRMQEKIAKSEEKYRTLIDKATDGIIITQHGFLKFVNEAFCKLTQYSENELIDKPYLDFVVAEDHKKMNSYHSRRMTGEDFQVMYRSKIMKKDGSILEVELNARTSEYNGEPAAFVIMRDITNRLRMEEALAKSEQKYRQLAEMLPQTIYELDMQGNITYLNQTGFRKFGISTYDLGVPAFSFIAPEEHERMKLNMMKSLTEGYSTPGNKYTAITKNGEKFPVMIFASPQYSGDKITGTCGIILDMSEHEAMEKALRESELKYRELTEMLPQTVYELDAQGNIIYFNQTGFKQFGLDESDFGKSSFNFIHPSQHEQMRENMRKTITEKSNSFGNKYTAVRKNGETFPAMTYAAPIISEDKVVGIRGLILDISEPEAMGKALRESEKRYRELAEMLPQTVYEHDMDGKLTYLNQAGKKTFGIESLETGVSARDLVVAEDIERMLGNMQKSSFGNSTSRGNSYTAMRLNGEKFPVMIFATPMISEEKVTGIRGIVIDMTEYVSMEKALRESERKYRTLIDKATDGILITQSGLFKFVNPAFCEMMQYTEKELINKPFIDVVDKEHHAEMLENHKRRMTGETFPAIYRAKLYRKDGSSLMVELNSRTTDFEGNPASFVITRDITDRLQTEEELRKAKKELEHLNQNLEIRVQESTLKLTEANTQLIRLQKENLQSQFEVLRQQVNPHFLFNSLNVLTSLIKLEPDLAEQFTEHLSKVYRYVLENKDNDLVSLQTELDFLDAYIFLLNIRFMDKIVVKVDIGEHKREYQILPLALQLLIENAIKHNAMSKRNPLKIDIFIDDENVLHVENNLQERESHMASTGVGLRNIAHRYHLLEMPEPEFVKTETKFIARVPLKY